MQGKRRRWNVALSASLLLAACPGRAATKHEAAPAPGAAPAARIAVAPLGFVAPSAVYLSYRMALTTLDFIDDGHLLFTFHKSGLMQRIPGDPADDEDQVIHAVVLEIASGRTLRQADWRMHDRERYLWALQDGKFLVRQRNALFLTDSGLDLHPYLSFDTDLQAVAVSPGRGLLAIEAQKFLPPTAAASHTKGNAAASAPPSLESPDETRQRRTELMLLRPGEKTVLDAGEIRNPVSLALTEDGFLDVKAGKQPNEWVIEQQSIEKATAKVGVMKSSCSPELTMLSAEAVLAQGCPVDARDDNVENAFSLTKGELWKGLWELRYIWPVFRPTLNGNRFAYESLAMNREIGAMDSFGAVDVTAQPVGVFDTASGKLELVKNASPVLTGGSNFALSADGSRFAILRDGAIEVYDLPPAK